MWCELLRGLRSQSGPWFEPLRIARSRASTRPIERDVDGIRAGNSPSALHSTPTEDTVCATT
jgi:hypothetical protein